MVGMLLAVEALICFFYFAQLGDTPLDLQTLLIFSAFFLIILSIFYGMTTTVNQKQIKVTFGIGLISKKFQMDRIGGIDVVRNPWYYGYGIRLIRNGWLYNVSGLDAVELKFRDTKGVIRIGSKHPAALKKAIEEQTA